MKIAIYPDYGSAYIPPFIKEQLKGDTWIENRVEMVNILEKLKPTHEEISQEICDTYETVEFNGENTFAYLKDKKNPNWIYVKNWDIQYPHIFVIKIVEVDTTRLWKISEYDGAESIEYFSEPKVVNKELNYAEW